MEFIFEVIDTTGRTIRLSQDRWSHIRGEHPEIVDPEEIVPTLTHPEKFFPATETKQSPGTSATTRSENVISRSRQSI